MNIIEKLLNSSKKEQEKLFESLNNQVIDSDSIISEVYSKYDDLVLKASEDMQQNIAKIVKDNYYSRCHRGAFIAGIFDIDSNAMIRTGMNTPPINLINLCQINHDCTRNLKTVVHGSNYDLCPACHARENIQYQYYSDNLVWVECGAVLKDNRMSFWDIYSSHKYHIYPCARCLNYSLIDGVKILATLKYDDKWSVSWHDVEKHAEFLLFSKVYDFLREK